MDLGNVSYSSMFADWANITEPCIFARSHASIFFMIVALIVGLIGNISLVVISLTNREMRTPPNLMIANLALGDLMFLVVVVPSSLAFYQDCLLLMSRIMCKLYIAVSFLTQGVSVYTLTALSLDRYQAITSPLRWRRGGTSNNHPKLRAFITVVMIWVTSLLFTAPSIKMADIYPNGNECHLPYTSFQTRVYFPIFFVGSYCVPLIAILVFYSMTAATLLHGLKSFKEINRTGTDRHHKSRVRLAVIILIAALSFAVCWLPHHVFTLLFEFCPDYNAIFSRPNIKLLFVLQQNLPVLSCCLNPILLYAMSSNYRRKAVMMLRKIFMCNSGLFKAKQPLFKARTWTLISLRTTSLTRGSPSQNKLSESRNLSFGSNERESKH